jgi:hypothetical protein
VARVVEEACVGALELGREVLHRLLEARQVRVDDEARLEARLLEGLRHVPGVVRGIAEGVPRVGAVAHDEGDATPARLSEGERRREEQEGRRDDASAA